MISRRRSPDGRGARLGSPVRDIFSSLRDITRPGNALRYPGSIPNIAWQPHYSRDSPIIFYIKSKMIGGIFLTSDACLRLG